MPRARYKLAAAGLAAAGLFLFARAGRVWRRCDVGRHWLFGKTRFDVAKEVRLMPVATHDQVLLHKGDCVVRNPVDHQAAGKTAQHEHEHPGHPSKNLLLHGVCGGRV